MPAVTELRTPPATQGAVISLYAQGTSQRKIAKHLSIDKNTVAAILKAYAQDRPKSVSRLQQLKPLAYDALEKGLTSGDARLGLDFLKVTDLAPAAEARYQVAGDLTVQQHLTLLPAASTTVTPSSNGTTGTDGDRSSQNAPPSDMSLSSHTNFSAFSLAELEAEVARRKALVVDAEVVG